MINSSRSVHNPYQQIRIRISSNQQINILKFGLGSEVHKSTSTWDPDPSRPYLELENLPVCR